MADKSFQYPGQLVNPELAERYSIWPHKLEKRVADDSATAARTSTQLRNLANSLEAVLLPQQLLALQAAASVADQLAQDLKGLRPWAKAYQQHVEEKTARKREQDLLDESHRRWVDDDDAVSEALDLLTFLSQNAAGADVDSFIAARRQHAQVRRMLISSEGKVALERLRTALEQYDVPRVRRNATLVIDHLGGSLGDGTVWFAGADDFVRWREAQLAARKTTALALRTTMLRSPSGS